MGQIRRVFGFWYGLPSEENPGFAVAWSPSPHFHRRGGAPVNVVHVTDGQAHTQTGQDMCVESEGDGGDASPPVKNLGGDVPPPDSRMKWPKSGAFSDF